MLDKNFMQIVALKQNKTLTKILNKYSDFLNVFFERDIFSAVKVNEP